MELQVYYEKENWSQMSAIWNLFLKLGNVIKIEKKLVYLWVTSKSPYMMLSNPYVVMVNEAILWTTGKTQLASATKKKHTTVVNLTLIIYAHSMIKNILCLHGSSCCAHAYSHSHPITVNFTTVIVVSVYFTYFNKLKIKKYLNFCVTVSNSNVLTICEPFDRRNIVILTLHNHEPVYISTWCIPYVYCTMKDYSNIVGGAPVKEIEI